MLLRIHWIYIFHIQCDFCVTNFTMRINFICHLFAFLNLSWNNTRQSVFSVSKQAGMRCVLAQNKKTRCVYFLDTIIVWSPRVWTRWWGARYHKGVEGVMQHFGGAVTSDSLFVCLCWCNALLMALSTERITASPSTHPQSSLTSCSYLSEI